LWLILEVNILILFYLLGADRYAWLNYSSLESLLLKPHRTYRHVLYVGSALYTLFSVFAMFCYIIWKEYSQGITIGWLLSGMVLLVWALITMWQSVWDVYKATKLAKMTLATDVMVSIDMGFSVKELEEDSRYANWMKRKTTELGITVNVLGSSLLLDLVFGAVSSGFAADFTLLAYGIVLKIVIGLMLWQQYDVDKEDLCVDPKYQEYNPFETLFSGDSATRTVRELKQQISLSSLSMQKSRSNDEIIFSVLRASTPDLQPPENGTSDIQTDLMGLGDYGPGDDLARDEKYGYKHTRIELYDDGDTNDDSVSIKYC